MVTTFKNRIIFYRHFLYGSALLIGTLIGTKFTLGAWPTIALYTASGLFILSSLLVTWTVNKYPEEFEEEMDHWKAL